MEDNIIKAGGAILIGGKSSRFGSDKASLEFAGETLSVRIYHQLNSILDSVCFISDRKNNSATADLPVFVDIESGVGPLGGLLTALKNCQYPWCFITGCDLPFFDPDLVSYLWQYAHEDPDIIVPVWAENIEPLNAFYHIRCIPAIVDSLAQNRYMVKGFWKNLRVKKVELTDHYSSDDLKKMFFNINTKLALAQALKMVQNDEIPE